MKHPVCIRRRKCMNSNTILFSSAVVSYLGRHKSSTSRSSQSIAVLTTLRPSRTDSVRTRNNFSKTVSFMYNLPGLVRFKRVAVYVMLLYKWCGSSICLGLLLNASWPGPWTGYAGVSVRPSMAMSSVLDPTAPRLRWRL